MYITGTQYNFLNRLHQLYDSLPAYDSFNAEFTGYTFDANEESKITKEQEKKLLTVGWDGGYLLNSSFNDGEAHWYTLGGFQDYHPSDGLGPAIEGGVLYFHHDDHNVSQPDIINFPDLSNNESLTVTIRAKAKDATFLSSSLLEFFVSLMDISSTEILLYSETVPLTVNLNTYTFTLTRSEFESQAPGHNWEDIKYAQFSLEGQIIGFISPGNVGPQVKNVSLTLS
jgi:hypothetical protein